MAPFTSSKAPALERILTDPEQSFRCQIHSFPCEIARWNYHPEHEIHLIRKSSGRVFVGDYIGTFEAGHLAFVNSNVPHNWVTQLSSGETIEGRDLVIQFEPQLLKDAAAVLPELKRFESGADIFRRSWEFTGETALRGARLAEEIYAAAGVSRLARFLDLLALLGATRERKPLASAGYTPRLDAAASKLMDQAMDFILRTLPGDVRAEETAARLGMSPTTFSRFFKRNAGHSFVDYMRKLRIGQACRLLTETDRLVTDVCFDVGYTNLSNFNRSFRAERGVTPTDYRRLSRLPNGNA